MRRTARRWAWFPLAAALLLLGGTLPPLSPAAAAAQAAVSAASVSSTGPSVVHGAALHHEPSFVGRGSGASSEQPHPVGLAAGAPPLPAAGGCWARVACPDGGPAGADGGHRWTRAPPAGARTVHLV